MKPTQITAALGLLRKCIPDLQVTTLEGNPEQPVVMQWMQK
jgi:hypothetical protein